jgi:hypothetical protein
MQVIAQGVAQVGLGATAVSEWLILLPNATNQTQSDLAVTGGSCIVEVLNGTALNATVNAVTTADKLTSTVVVDTAAGFQEGSNYQILCNITLTNGLYVNGVKNYIYVNEHVSFLQYILQLVGLAQGTQSTVNQTLSISNQTLQIVTALNNTGPNQIYEQLPEIKVEDVGVWKMYPAVVSAKLVRGSANIDNASCGASIYDFSNVDVFDAAASYDVGTELYTFGWTPQKIGKYAVRWNCSSGGLYSAVVYATSSVDVSSGLKAVTTK